MQCKKKTIFFKTFVSKYDLQSKYFEYIPVRGILIIIEKVQKGPSGFIRNFNERYFN